MGRGFLAGIFWGVIVSVAILLVSNVALDRQQLSFPRPEAVPVEVPAGSEFDQARVETDPVVPDAETRPEAETPRDVVAPEDIVEAPPSFDTSSLEVPQPSVDGPDDLGELPAVADGVEIDVTGPGPDTPVQPIPNTDLEVPDVPSAAPETTVEAPGAMEGDANVAEGLDADIAALAPERPEIPAIEPPADAPVSTAPTAEAPPPSDTGSAAAPDSPSAPRLMTAPQVIEAPSGQGIVTLDGGDSFFEPVENIANLAPQVETDRLPRIGAEPESGASPPVVRRGVEEIDETEEGAKGVDRTAPVREGPAIRAWSLAFEPEGSKPLFSLVLVHPDNAMPEPQVVRLLPKTVAFAVDAGLPDAGDIADAYREIGREVVMIPSLPIGATPQDVEVALRVNLEAVPEAVAVMDASGESFQSDRAAVAQLVDVVLSTGHGLITFPRGLNTAHQRAQREGVPAGLIFRDIDGDGQSDEQIRRAMDRAAFRARADRPVILVGNATALTVSAIMEWTLGSRAASVTLAPVSAALAASPS